MRRLRLATWVAVMGVAMPVVAQELEIPVEGFLTDVDGVAVQGIIDVELRVYDAPAGGAPLFAELHEGVMVDRGFFYLGLGAVDGLAAELFAAQSPMALDPNRYLSVTVVGDGEQTPRIKLGFVPFAVRALEPGPAGAAGPAGATGAAGATGVVGPAGATGPVGPAGAPGPVGATGPAGAGGALGPIGPVGPPGPTGSGGATGAAGPRGATGAVGPQGAQGVAGPTGAPGASGSSSFQLSGEVHVQSGGNGTAWLSTGRSQSNSICFLTRTFVEETDVGDERAGCIVQIIGGVWHVGAYRESGDAVADCSARCLSW